MTLIIILVIVAIIVIACISIYNNLVKLRNNRENAFANIDVQLKQRHDLIPQLVATVKGYAQHEKELLERVTQARAAAMRCYKLTAFRPICARFSLLSAIASAMDAAFDRIASKALIPPVSGFF